MITSLTLLTFCVFTAAIEPAPGNPQTDWLVSLQPSPARVIENPDAHEVILDNGLIRRTFRLAPNAATIRLENRITRAECLRGVKPEAAIELDGKRYAIGGLIGQPDYAYLDPAWIPELKSDPEAFQFTGYQTGVPEAPYPWTPKRGAPEMPWPPKGVTLTLSFAPPASLLPAAQGLIIEVHYALYEGIPVIGKWVSVKNGSAKPIEIAALETEILAVTESEKSRLHVESNYTFNTMQTTWWGPDADYGSQVDYNLQSPVLMTSKYPLGPGVLIESNAGFTSFTTYELLQDSDSRERCGLARRRMMRTLAPQVLENPIFMHVRNASSDAIRLAVDQCAETGFEMVIMTFGSGFDVESEDPAYIARLKSDAAYAHAKGIELGGYTLTCASRDVGPENNCIDPKTSKPGSMFGQSACLASQWADGYFDRVFHFVDATGLDMLETDGPFHGDVCASTQHAHHRGLADSQLAQWQRYVDFCHACRQRGVFINSPDAYYLNGSNKCAMGYRETNWSLPRDRQIIIARQNIYDATYDKTPSMGWMFVPLVEYHGGGAAATIEPLSEHLDAYEQHLAYNFGAGIQACYRGPRLYDTDATKAVVKKWVDFYKAHRAILDSDIIHVRRADGKDLDGFLHVNPNLPEKGLAMLFNPASETIETKWTLPLYYTGLTETAQIQEQSNTPITCPLDRAYNVHFPVKIPPKGITWFVVK